jgi:putative MATE family efflux protein
MIHIISYIKKLFIYFFQAIFGVEKEYTTGSINKAIFMLSIPMIVEMSFESLFAVIDIFFVSQVSVNAVATVGLTESVMMIIYSIAIGLSMATTAIVARRVGEKNVQRASDAAFQSILIGVSFAAVLGTIGFFFAEDILRLMGGEEDLIAEGSWYTKIMFAGNVSILLLFLINAIFRGAGDANMAMAALIISNVLNIILDPLLIFGIGPFPEMGVAGAAIATTIGRSVGVLFQFFILFFGGSIIRLTIKNVVFRVKTVMEILRIAFGGVFQFLVESLSWMFLIRIISIFGASALAGYTVAFRIIVFTILPSWGMSNAAATLVGQNLGAGKPERAEASVWKTALYNMVFLGLVSIVFYLYADFFVGIFTEDPEVVRYAVLGLKVICLGYIFFAYGMVISQSFNGAGDTMTPLIINIVCFWVIQIPMAYFLSVYTNLEVLGTLATIAICHSIHAIISVVIFKKGKWKSTAV